MSETIFALATPPGKSSVAIIRVSGSMASEGLRALAGRVLPPRHATRVTLRCPASSEWIDDALALWFPGPHSFTGEDVVEFHLHGSRAVIQEVIQALLALPGYRHAEPGEFSRRAFLNGKMDLAQAEGLIDLIEAETSLQKRQALRQFGGETSQAYEALRARILHILALMEAYIDFPDEEIPPQMLALAKEEAGALHAFIKVRLQDRRSGEKLREGFRVAILGPPNAGKSSLLNYLARRDVAIVSPIPGTTRDVLEVHLDIAGFPVTIADTAGLRISGDDIESEGMQRARRRGEEADLKIVMLDISNLSSGDVIWGALDDRALLVLNKSDLWKAELNLPSLHPEQIAISLKEERRLDDLLAWLEKKLCEACISAEIPFITQLRHRRLMEEAQAHLEFFLQQREIELMAEELRLTAQAIGKITGRIYVEEILGEIFSQFCIGK